MLLARASVTTADLVNRTIDDQRGDSVTGAKPSWAPDNGWAQGQICGTCGINSALVDIDKVHDGTWLDSTYRPGQPDSVITVSFAGTAVYVFNLIANSYGGIGTQTNLSFSIDGTYMGQYIHLPDPSSTILYNVCVFSTSNLPNQTHTLEMRATGPNGSLILFDYIVYTFDEPTTSGPSGPSSSSTVSTSVSSLFTVAPNPPNNSPQISPGITSIDSMSNSSTQGSPGLSNLPGSIATGSTGLSVTSQPINLSSNAPPSTGTPGSASTQGSAIPTQAGSTQGPSSHSVSMGVVAGGVAGGALLVAVAVALALCGGEEPLAAAPPEPTHTDLAQVQLVASADCAALSAVHSESAQPASFDRDTSGSPLAPSVTREDPALQLHLRLLMIEVRQSRLDAASMDVDAPSMLNLLHSLITTANLVNRTIDDQLGDIVTGAVPSKAPDDKWAQAQTCDTCGIHPGEVDVSKAHDGTWSDSTYHPGEPDRVITASFAGTAVYVFNLIANTFPYITTETNLSFSIDGTYMGQYIHLPDPPSTILYNVCVFSTSNLPNQTHTLEIRANGPTASLILFDYIVYTFDEPTTTSGPSTPSTSSTSSTVSTSTSSHVTSVPNSPNTPPPGISRSMSTMPIISSSTVSLTTTLSSHNATGIGSNVTAQSISSSSDTGSNPPSTGAPGSASTQSSAIPTQAGSTQGPSSHSVSMGVVAGGVADGEDGPQPLCVAQGERAVALSVEPRTVPMESTPCPQTEPLSGIGFHSPALRGAHPRIALSADAAALSAAHSGSAQPASFDRDTSGSPLAPSVTREDPALQEIRRLRGQDVGQPTDDDLPPHYDQLSER
ncbi:hypothetical protein ACG7TL_005297 [Trametes sanguinea]